MYIVEIKNVAGNEPAACHVLVHVAVDAALRGVRDIRLVLRQGEDRILNADADYDAGDASTSLAWEIANCPELRGRENRMLLAAQAVLRHADPTKAFRGFIRHVRCLTGHDGWLDRHPLELGAISFEF